MYTVYLVANRNVLYLISGSPLGCQYILCPINTSKELNIPVGQERIGIVNVSFR